MIKEIKVADLPDFDVVDYLDSEEAIAQYIPIVQEENDPAALVHALGVAARACAALGVKLVAQPGH